MSTSPNSIPPASPLPEKPTGSAGQLTSGNDCWNKIGVSGDRSCPELSKYVHCRNCPVFVAGGQQLLDRPAPEGYLEQWRQVLASPPAQEKTELLSLAFLRLGEEWLALDTAVFKEATEPRPIHRIPHRSNEALLGLVSIRGELLLCVSVANLLGIEIKMPEASSSPGIAPSDTDAGGHRKRKKPSFHRLVVISRPGDTWAFPVDELYGVQRVERQELHNPPATLSRSAVSFTKAVLTWQERTVACLDSQALFNGIRKRVL